MADVGEPGAIVEHGQVKRVRAATSLGDEERMALMMSLHAGMMRSRLRRALLLLSMSIMVALVGFLMAGLMLLATIEATQRNDYGEVQTGGGGRHGLAVALLAGMSALTLAWGLIVRTPSVVLCVRGSLEYTALMLMNLKRGQRYKYAKIPSQSTNPEDALQRELHQLKFEAGLTGWNEERLEEQLQLVEEAYSAHHDSDAPSKRDVLGKEVKKLVSMIQHTFGAMPKVLAVVSIAFAISVCGVGAMGFFLTIGIAHMPTKQDDQFAIEYCWQTLNFIFTIVCVYKGPGRIRLCYHLWRHDYEEIIDGVPRSLMVPGVLLTRREVIRIAALRITNFCAQYVLNYFMWAWLPQCSDETLDRHVECASRIPGVVPAFMVIGMGTDMTSNILLHKYIAQCDYLLWPTVSASGDVLRPASCEQSAWLEQASANRAGKDIQDPDTIAAGIPSAPATSDAKLVAQEPPSDEPASWREYDFPIKEENFMTEELRAATELEAAEQLESTLADLSAAKPQLPVSSQVNDGIDIDGITIGNVPAGFVIKAASRSNSRGGPGGCFKSWVCSGFCQ